MSDDKEQQEQQEQETAATVTADQGADPKVPFAGSEISDETWQAASSAWIDDYVRNSPISANTEAWNHLNNSLSHLREYLTKGPLKRE
jgi:hypothetical protein